MTQATRSFLVRLKRHLAAHPEKRDALKEFYFKHTGTRLHNRTLDHWLALDRGMTLCCALPVLRWMQLEDQIIPGTKESGLFHYATPRK